MQQKRLRKANFQKTSATENKTAVELSKITGINIPNMAERLPTKKQTKEQMEIQAGIKKNREAEKARKLAKLIKETEKKEYFEKQALKKARKEAAQKVLKEKKPLSAEQRQKKKEKRKEKKLRAKGLNSQDKSSLNDKV